MTAPVTTEQAYYWLRELCPPKVDPHLTERVHNQAKRNVAARGDKWIMPKDIDEAYKQLREAAA